MSQHLNPIEIFRVLSKYQTDFILVGGICAVLHGAPVTTFDLDIVHSRAPKNLRRLVSAVKDLDGHYRGHPKRIVPDAEKLASSGHHLLMTRLGPLDLLGTIENGEDYDSLFDKSEVVQIDQMEIRIMSLECLIQIKESSNRDKDRLILPILRRTLEEIRHPKPSPERDSNA
jgi:hypothetical protein